ncbi:RRQRL motif-containing zinc-binding protein [Amycolatopsis coloradensis]|uniref:RRQRL motif-containing zinc-binding protein n=1 Tax=Amycolatopsis coloradensis TaxID=76021 RepID=A0ACD5BD72_9PSEU
MARQYPWVLAAVPWSPDLEYTRGRLYGKPLLSRNTAPRHLLATRRQLRASGKRPGGQDPVAFLYFRCRKAGKTVYANLYLIDAAKPVRPMTPGRREALAKAMAARRTCRECRETGYAELPKAHRTCEACLYSAGLEPDSYLHEFLRGEPTLDAAGHAALSTHDHIAIGWELAG